MLENLQSIIPPSVSDLINIQLQSLQINSPIFSIYNVLNLPKDQLHTISTIYNILGSKYQKNKYPYFFITGLARTEKLFIINIITEDLKNKGSNYLLLSSTAL